MTNSKDTNGKDVEVQVLKENFDENQCAISKTCMFLLLISGLIVLAGLAFELLNTILSFIKLNILLFLFGSLFYIASIIGFIFCVIALIRGMKYYIEYKFALMFMAGEFVYSLILPLRAVKISQASLYSIGVGILAIISAYFVMVAAIKISSFCGNKRYIALLLLYIVLFSIYTIFGCFIKTKSLLGLFNILLGMVAEAVLLYTYYYNYLTLKKLHENKGYVDV